VIKHGLFNLNILIYEEMLYNFIKGGCFMKYLFKTLLATIILFLFLKIVFYLLDNSHEIEYNIGNFKVSEKFKITNGNHNYFFKLKNEEYEISFSLNKNYKKSEKVLENIKYYKQEGCVLPIFKKGEIIYDVMCKKDNTVYYNYDLKENIDTSTISGYSENKFSDIAKASSYEENKIYKANIPKNHYLFVENYKGIVLINNDINFIKLFDHDVYKKDISTVVSKYYLVANYNDDLTFKSFYLVNLVNGRQKEIRSINEISFDSYIQGVVDDKVYLYDLDSNVQYEIDIENEMVNKIASDNDIKYYNGKWTTMTLKEAKEHKVFNPNYSNKLSNYTKVDKINNYYAYEKNGKYYDVYLIDKNDLNQRTYLFKTSDIQSVTYFDNYIYFKKDNVYYNYGNRGIRKLIENQEMNFNSSLKFGVYEK
jgi:hypothetical protein